MHQCGLDYLNRISNCFWKLHETPNRRRFVHLSGSEFALLLRFFNVDVGVILRGGFHLRSHLRVRAERRSAAVLSARPPVSQLFASAPQQIAFWSQLCEPSPESKLSFKHKLPGKSTKLHRSQLRASKLGIWRNKIFHKLCMLRRNCDIMCLRLYALHFFIIIVEECTKIILTLLRFVN